MDWNQFTTWERLRHPSLTVWGSSNSGYSVILRCCGSMVLINKNCPQSLLYHGRAPSLPTGSASEKGKADVTLCRAGKLKVVFQQQHQTNLSQKLPRFPHFQVRDEDTSPVTSFESLCQKHAANPRIVAVEAEFLRKGRNSHHFHHPELLGVFKPGSLHYVKDAALPEVFFQPKAAL